MLETVDGPFHLEWRLLSGECCGSKVRKARHSHIMKDFECQAEVKHAISTAIQEKKNLEISKCLCIKLSLIPSTILYFGIYHIATVGMSLVPIGLELYEHNSLVV